MTSPIVETKQLARRYRVGGSNVDALRGVDITVQRGEFVAVAGVSGSGKSTLLHLLGGLDRPSSGQIDVDGLALAKASDAQRTLHRRRRVGFIFQSFNLLPRLTALENVALPLMFAGIPRKQREQRADALLREVGLEQRLNHYPSQLSGGEQQRVAIARALVHNPSLVLADEPTGNLDSKTGAEILSLLRQLNKERSVTVVLVTHDPKAAAMADRVIYLNDGQVDRIETATNAHRATVAEPPQSPAVRRSGLRVGDLLRSAFSNLSRRGIRSGLTVFGVLIGVITIVTMLSVAVGVEMEVRRNVEAVGLETVYVSPPLPQTANIDAYSDALPATPITPESIAKLSAMPEIASVAPIVNLPGYLDIRVALGERAVLAQIAGGMVRLNPFATEDVSIVAGRKLGTRDSRGVVLPVRLADDLGATNYGSLVGRPLSLIVRLPRGETKEFPVTVVGVQREGYHGLALGYQDATDIKMWWYGQPDILNTRGYDGLVIKAANTGSVAAVEARVRAMGFQATSLGQFLDLANRIFAMLNAMLGSVGGLALLVAALGVTNTMIMAVYERTREIGVMKAIGASSGEVLRLFMAEASLIGFLGGALGLIFGGLLGRAVDGVAHWYLRSQNVQGVGALSVVPLWLAIGVLVFGTLIGLAAGIYPALRAARLDPVAALRNE